MKQLKITQVSADWIRDNIGDDRIYRILLCDDGNYGHSHTVARMKPLKNMTIEEYNNSIAANGQYGFILVEAVDDGH